MEGEYYIDKATGYLYIYKTADFDTSEILLSALTSPIINAASVSNITLKNFVLRATSSNGMNISGINIVIDNCDIYNVQSGGIYANGTNITIQNSELAYLGAYGIQIQGGVIATLTSSGNLVYNNYIHDFAVIQKTSQHGIDVRGCGNVVSHNEVSNAPHQAIFWEGPNNVLEYNEVYNVCLETSDCGAFYHGRDYISYGTVIRYNYIHDIGTKNASAHGIYWDDGLSGQTAYGNVIANTYRFGFLIEAAETMWSKTIL